jgi:antitoxin component of RelBE/YafQ-DinJ toxin-antitoxin module
MDTIGAKVPSDVKRAAQAEARRAGMTTSEWLRYQLRRLTDTEPRTLDELDDTAEKPAATT